MSELESIKRPDGKQCPAYIARPKGEPKGGVIVIQEWWGLNPQIQRTADRLADLGFVAVVPDLYRGNLAQDAAEATHLMNELDFADAATQDLRGCAQHLKAQGQNKVGLVGFCMGGALTILGALLVPEADAAVCFYGIPPADAADPGQIRIPLQCHFASHDDWCTPKAVDALEEKLKTGGVDYEIFRYDAQHAFMNEKRPEVYDEGAAKTAWERAVAFFEKQL